MKTITVAELRQNPTPALAEVAAGATLTVTKHRRPVALLTPPVDDAVLRVIPARSSVPSRLGSRPRDDVQSYEATEALLSQMASEW